MENTTIRERYLKLYSGAIADMLDKHGYRNQVLPQFITPFTRANRVAGPAFTGQGYPCAADSDDTEMRLRMLDSITPGTVSVWACGGGVASAHWERSCPRRRANAAARAPFSTEVSATSTSSTR
jgi:regulator of RNase E activity RraA